MRKTLPLIILMLALIGLGCAKKAPPPLPEPTAQEYFDSGLRAYKMENFQQAAQNFEMATAKSPSMQDAHYYLGLTYWKLNMLGNAAKSFVEVLNLNPGHLYARESLGILMYRQGNFPEAKRNLEAARNLASINPEVYLALGRIYAMESRCPEALEAFQRGLSVDSSNLALKGELDQARKTCGKGVKAQPRRKVQGAPQESLTGGAAPLAPGQF
jgi:tetratricopeptide (TPR) repeat protein